MFHNLLMKKRVVVGLSVAMLAIAGAAFAYFTTEGTGTGRGTVGTSTALTVTPAEPTGTIYPGEGASTFTYTVTNPGPGHQVVHTTTATVASLNTNITQGGVEVAGCKSAWFTAANTPPAETDLESGKSVSGSVKVTMANVTESQDSCKLAKPDITVHAS
jgi:hypothetical protein